MDFSEILKHFYPDIIMKFSVTCLRLHSTFRELLPAETIRSRFLDYFIKDNEHQFVKSSSVYPHFDYATPFVNAGMCQVIFLIIYFLYKEISHTVKSKKIFCAV